MILPIRLWPDPVLRLRCAPVRMFDAALAALAQDMLDTMYAAPGRGLAAPQVGQTCRMFVMDVAWKTGAPDPFVCINPVIVQAGDVVVTAEEGCLSIPDTPMQITRPAAITLVWQDVTGQDQRADLDGFAAACAQHELDHLDGIVIFDRVAPELRASLEAGFLT